MIEILKEYGEENILTLLGVENLTDKGDYWSFSSPWRQDKNPSMVLYKENLYCIDFGGGFKGSLFKLIKEMSGQSAFTLLNIKDAYSASFENSLKKSPRKKERDFQFKKIRKIEFTDGNITWGSAILNQPDVADYLTSRKITRKFIEEFGLGFTRKVTMNGVPVYNRLLIPIMDTEGKNIQSYEARDITRKSNKKVLYPKGGSMSTLFNYHQLNKEEPVIVVEGIMDTPLIWRGLSTNVTTTFGIQLTKYQIKLLNTLPKIILFPDSDDGGNRFIENLDEAYENEFEIMTVPGKDPGDSCITEIKKAYNTRVKSVEYFLEKSGLFPKKEKIEWV